LAFSVSSLSAISQAKETSLKLMTIHSGAGFLQVLNGKKIWFLAPFEVGNDQIRFDPNITTKGWYEDEYRTRKDLRSLITRCTLYKGDVIYFPPMWKHATYNSDSWNSWVSTFLK
jgi:hypothetical protein